MRSSRRFPLRAAAAMTVAGAVSVAAAAWAPDAQAQQVEARGFAVERFVPSAPGGGWFVMDALDMRGGLGGAMAMTLSYAHNPLEVATTDGTQHLAVVSKEAFADF